MKELKNWKEVSKGYFRYVISSNVAYEIFIENWWHDTPIETAKASLCIVGDWYYKNGKSITEREWLGEELPIKELLEIAYKDYKENNK
jgi:hypothetical protein